ncbi:hypothetical protein QUF63_07805 [Anaerolineales bacterium HSG25]|nr:hypothetical protein [Anaerolineales bacterium HSG25]
METISYQNTESIRITNDHVELIITKSVGPRILSYKLIDGDNLFAALPDLTIPCPNHDDISLRGGHRLWHAPELPERTYLPDDQPVEITAIPNGVEVVQPIETETGLVKSLLITLSDQDSTVQVEHRFKNIGLWPLELAPWAITQMKLGGMGILPQTTMDTGLLPNRQLAIWPYTDLTSEQIQIGKQYIFIHAAEQTQPLKLGFANPRGWLAYHHGQTLFVKWATYQPTADYCDFGSSSECYCNHQFLELETLAPKTLVTPNQTVSHIETWRLYAGMELEADEATVHEKLQFLDEVAHAG